MIEKKPTILGVYKELNLIGKEIHLKIGKESGEDDSEVYYVDPDPDVTESITCTDCVCRHAEMKFRDKLDSMQIKFVLPKTLRFSDNVNINLTRQKTKG